MSNQTDTDLISKFFIKQEEQEKRIEKLEKQIKKLEEEIAYIKSVANRNNILY